jgi:hypothetical protein
MNVKTRRPRKLIARPPPTPRPSRIRLFKALGQVRSGCLGKLNMRISSKSHHGRNSPFAPHMSPQSLLVKPETKPQIPNRHCRDQQTGVIGIVSPAYIFFRRIAESC